MYLAKRNALPALLVLAMMAAAPALGASYTVGENYQESSYATSNFPPAASACNSLTYCYIEFNKVPTGKQLVVTHVSCGISASAGEPVSMYLGVRNSNGNATERFTFMTPLIYPSNQPGSNIVANNEALQLYNQGQRPEVYIGMNAAGNILGSCTIAGQLLDKPAPL